MRRILIEGGPATVSRFLEARCLDRLHVVVAPIILGGGRSSLDLAPITRCEQALRPHTRTHVLGDEVLFDCDLSAQRRADRRGKEIDVTDPHCERPGATSSRRSREPGGKHRRHDARSRRAASAQPASIAIWMSRRVGPNCQSDRP